MSQQASGAASDMIPVLGNLQSVGPVGPVGPVGQTSPALATLSAHSTLSNPLPPANNLSVPLQQPQQPQQAQQTQQPQQTQFLTSQPSKLSSTTQQQSSTSSSSADFPQFLTKTRLQDLVREVDPTEQLDEEVEEMLLQLADDFVETTVNAACLLAKHRHANTVEVKDVQLHLERNWNMWIPGFGTDEVRPYKRATVTEAHKQRLALIRKSIKKY